jgi:hypothetical protein
VSIYALASILVGVPIFYAWRAWSGSKPVADDLEG